MLSDALEVSRSLRAAGIATVTRHPDIKPLGKRDVWRAVLAGNGRLSRLEVVQREDAPSFWTLRDGNHNSFPLVPISGENKLKALRRVPEDEPLLPIAADRRAPLARRVDAFLAVRANTVLALGMLTPWPSYRQRLAERREQLAPLRSTEASAVCSLLDCVLGSDGGELLLEIDEALVDRLREAPDTASLELAVKTAFVGPAEVLLDLDPGPGRLRAADPLQVPGLSEGLRQSAGEGVRAVCALTGRREVIEDDKFPQANLPVLGPTYLFARNPDIPSAARYERSGAASFQVAREVAVELSAALEALARPERQERTWSAVPSERPGQYDLLLCFVGGDEAWTRDLPLAGGLAGHGDPAAAREAQFESLASDLVKLAKGRDVAFDSSARFLVLRKVDPGNRKVIYSRSATVTELALAAQRWTDGCHNVPPGFELPVWSKQARAAARASPRVISPGALVALGRDLFQGEGRERVQAPGPSFATAMRLFLGSEHARAAEARGLLRHFLNRRHRLMAGVAHAARRGDLSGYDTRAALDSAGLLGLLLFQHRPSIRKEEYMQDPGFLLGQLLAGADVLHRGYCEDQRGGAIPPSLLGNQLLGLAQRAPQSALAQLCRRWRVYAGWAEKKRRDRRQDLRVPDRSAKGERSIYYGVHATWRMRELAEQLEGRLPAAADDPFRAELLLGYMTGLPRRGKAESPETSTEDDLLEGVRE